MIKLKVTTHLGTSRSVGRKKRVRNVQSRQSKFSPRSKNVVLALNITVFAFPREGIEIELHHAQEVISGESILIENFKNQLVFRWFHPEDEFFIPLWIQSTFFRLCKHRIFHLKMIFCHHFAQKTVERINMMLLPPLRHQWSPNQSLDKDQRPQRYLFWPSCGLQ